MRACRSAIATIFSTRFRPIGWSGRLAMSAARSLCPPARSVSWLFKVGTAPHVNTFGLGETGRYRTNVWEYAGVNTFRAGRLEELELHPTVKPVELVGDAIKDCSRRADIVPVS